MPESNTESPSKVEIKVLNQAHPDYDAKKLTQIRALAEGGDTWHEPGLKGYWLPRNPAEPPDVYHNRLSLAVYENEVGPLIKQINAHLFTEPLSAQGLPDESYWPRFLQNCDKNGTGISSLFSTLNEHALVGRRAFVWVNLPRRGVAVQNRAQEEALGYLDAYLSLLTPEQVINWDQPEPHGPLSYVVIRDLIYEQASPLSARERKMRWTVIDQYRISRYVFVCKDDKDPTEHDVATLESSFEHRIGFCPVTMLELPPSLWIMRQVFDRVVGLLRATNDRAWALHQAANELLVITESRSTTEDVVPTLGHGHYVRLTRDDTGSDTATYVAPSGVAFDHLAKLEQDKREGLYRALQAMASAGGTESSRVTQSGQSKALDWQAMDIVLAAYSTLVKTCAKKVLEQVLRIRAVSESKARTQIDDLSVDGLESWATEDLITFLESCALAVEAKRASPKFVQSLALIQAKRVLGDKVSSERMAEIETEIMASPGASGDAEQEAAAEEDENTDPESPDDDTQDEQGEDTDPDSEEEDDTDPGNSE